MALGRVHDGFREPENRPGLREVARLERYGPFQLPKSLLPVEARLRVTVYVTHAALQD